MAKFTPGPTVAAVSGSVGGTVFSRNRYGAYMRFRAIPTVSTTEYALAAKSRLQTVSSAWQSRTAAEKLSWRVWAEQNPVQDALGFTQIVTGHVAYVGLNTRLALIGGVAITIPPITPSPIMTTDLTLTTDIGPGNFTINFLPTPLGAAEKLYAYACLQDSIGVNYVENYLRYIGVSAAAQGNPFDFQGIFQARFGPPVVGQIVHVKVSVIDTLSGQISAPMRAQGTVIDTTV